MIAPVLLLFLLWFGVATVWVEGLWAVSLLEAGAFLTFSWILVNSVRRGTHQRLPWPAWCLAAISGWGFLQAALGWSATPAETEWTALYWLAAACFVCLGAAMPDRRQFVQALLWSGAVMTVLALAQLYTSGGKILWFVATRYNDRVFGTFANYNHYACFIELVFPLALWRTFKPLPDWWIYGGVSALMYGSVIASTSRAGGVLVTLELVVVVAQALYRYRGDRQALRKASAVLGMLVLFSLAAGYQDIWQRFLLPDPFQGRREFQQSTIRMIQARPLTGFGLGSWTFVYPAYAVADFGVIANHAHSEWLQWAAEGGLGVPAVMLALFFLALRRSLSSAVGVGLVFVLVHSLVDYPLVRLGLGCWWFVMLGLVTRPEVTPTRAQHLRRGVQVTSSD